MNKALSVVIVTYNSNTVLFDCLNSINKYNDFGDDLEVIIVDNSPYDSISSSFETSSFNFSLVYKHNPDNGGFGLGNNVGVGISTSDYLLFLNPDTILVEPVFSYSIRMLEKKGVSVLGYTLIDESGNTNNSFGLLPEYNLIYAFLPMKIIYFLVIKLGLFRASVFPWGAAFLMRKSDFYNAGMFDERIFLCNEEPDLFHRLEKQSCVISSKKIVHLEGHTTEVEGFRFQCWLDSTEYYFKKHSLNYKKFVRNEIYVNKLKLFLRKILRLEHSHVSSYIEKMNSELIRIQRNSNHNE